MAKFFLFVIFANTLLCICHSNDTRTSQDDLIKKFFRNNEEFVVLPKKEVEINTQSPPVEATTVVTQTITTTSVKKYKSCGYQRECVPRWLCKSGSINKSGKNLITFRINEEATCGPWEKCCDIFNKTTVPIVKPLPQEIREGCGYRNPEGVGYTIAGGKENESQFGEFPWMVAIIKQTKLPVEIEKPYACGGSIIAPNVVITAAHCIQGNALESLAIVAGEWDVSQEDEILPTQKRSVKQIIIHENFDMEVLFNDIALLFTDFPFEWAQNIRPICLPDKDFVFNAERCYATGWGKEKFGKNSTYPVILKKIDLPMIPQGKCQEQLRDTRLGLYFELDESFLCAGGEKDKDTCKGDGGSPLICPISGMKDRYSQVGIVAWGIECGKENVPAVYANIIHLREWINKQLSAKNVDFKHFST